MSFDGDNAGMDVQVTKTACQREASVQEYGRIQETGFTGETRRERAPKVQGPVKAGRNSQAKGLGPRCLLESFKAWAWAPTG